MPEGLKKSKEAMAVEWKGESGTRCGHSDEGIAGNGGRQMT